MATTFEIFPAIGIARLGISPEFFIGPEPDVPFDLRRRDQHDNLLRQAARFRVFQCERDDATGMLVKADEIAPQSATIRWRVHIVNRKAAAPRFNDGQPGGGNRNGAAGNEQVDAALIIDPGEKNIKSGDSAVLLDGGKFHGIPVSLGRLEVESTGRLLVLGGQGKSQSVNGAPLPDRASFADNDGWHDDVGDGSVNAQLTFTNGQTADAKGAWVIVAPPDFAPQIQNVVTLYDAILDLAIQRGTASKAPVIVYNRHVRPILERAMSMQWVNRQARLGYDDPVTGQPAPGPGGHAVGGPGDFSSMLDTLGDPAQPNQPRMRIFRLLRNPATGSFPVPPPVPRLKQMPRLNDTQFSGKVLPLTREQYRAMELWAQGNFQTSDPAGIAPELAPDALTRVALEACAGGGFFPGIEAGRIMIRPDIYLPNESFRFSHTVLQPGQITAQNALPWQADFFDCAWDTEKLLAWWPAQRPDDVLQIADGMPVPWARGVNRFQDMINNWHKLGFVKADAGNPGIFVETERTLP